MSPSAPSESGSSALRSPYGNRWIRRSLLLFSLTILGYVMAEAFSARYWNLALKEGEPDSSVSVLGTILPQIGMESAYHLLFLPGIRFGVPLGLVFLAVGLRQIRRGQGLSAPPRPGSDWIWPLLTRISLLFLAFAAYKVAAFRPTRDFFATVAIGETRTRVESRLGSPRDVQPSSCIGDSAKSCETRVYAVAAMPLDPLLQWQLIAQFEDDTIVFGRILGPGGRTIRLLETMD